MTSSKEPTDIIGPIDHLPFLPHIDDVKVEEDKYTNISSNRSTILFNPTIRSGIVRIEFLNVFDLDGIGIADESVHYDRDQWPFDKGKENIVYVRPIGKISHIGMGFAEGNDGFHKQGQRVAIELNMDANPRTMTLFVDDKEQKIYVVGIPPAVRFWAFLLRNNSSFKILKFERLAEPTAKHSFFSSKKYEFGKEWK
ncbi:MAG: hypothetical protein EZS28_039401 [Streblomastix strix]|uniref:SPRY domain-containing protein n=1 Tax=Streblomastix strix TaxID=222440 RepID=A0A5J4U543_9EUKA|nr:MAG: hypothetical protein EZS28_039401 [Streblomastix strix]